MQVEGSLQTMVVDVVDKGPGLGNTRSIPAPTCPTALVPVHIHDEHVHRDVVVFNIADNLHELGLRVGPIATIPVAEDVFRWHRHTASHLDEVAKAFLVLMPVAQEVPIDGSFVDGIRPPCDALILRLEGVCCAAVAPFGSRTFINDAPTGA